MFRRPGTGGASRIREYLFAEIGLVCPHKRSCRRCDARVTPAEFA